LRLRPCHHSPCDASFAAREVLTQGADPNDCIVAVMVGAPPRRDARFRRKDWPTDTCLRTQRRRQLAHPSAPIITAKAWVRYPTHHIAAATIATSTRHQTTSSRQLHSDLRLFGDSSGWVMTNSRQAFTPRHNTKPIALFPARRKMFVVISLGLRNLI
jgi:hypothetical protein